MQDGKSIGRVDPCIMGCLSVGLTHAVRDVYQWG